MVHVQPREASSHHRGQVAAAPEFGLIQAGQGRVAGVAMERTEQGAPVVDQPGERLQSAALAPPAQRERSAEEGRTRVQGRGLAACGAELQVEMAGYPWLPLAVKHTTEGMVVDVVACGDRLGQPHV